MIYVLDFRCESVGGAVGGGDLYHAGYKFGRRKSRDNLSAAKSIAFLIHGFNVDRESGINGLGNLATFLKAGEYDAIVLVLWPGDSHANFLSYSWEGEDADDTAVAFSQYIDDIVSSEARLSFVTHSKGARVCLETVKRLPLNGPRVDRIVLMAPAIDDFSLSAPNVYQTITKRVSRLAVLASRDDLVLKLAYPAGDLLQAFIFSGTDEAGFALGHHGPRPYSDAAGSHPVPRPAVLLHTQIDEIDLSRNSGHGHYIPDFESGKQPKDRKQKNQESASVYASRFLAGDDTVEYI